MLLLPVESKDCLLRDKQTAFKEAQAEGLDLRETLHRLQGKAGLHIRPRGAGLKKRQLAYKEIYQGLHPRPSSAFVALDRAPGPPACSLSSFPTLRPDGSPGHSSSYPEPSPPAHRLVEETDLETAENTNLFVRQEPEKKT